MKNVLTSFVLLGSALTLNAQVLNYGFEVGDALPGVVDTVNVYQAWKDAGGTFSYTATPAYAGEYAFNFHTPEGAGTGNRWERVLRFTQLGLKENTSYRVSYYAMAPESASLCVALMRGDLNADMPLLCAGSGTASYTDQVYTQTGFNASAYVRKSAVFFNPSDSVQEANFPSFKSEGTLPDMDYLRLSFLSEGDYLLDNVMIEEANIAGVTFNGDVLSVDFGYATNLLSLAKNTAEGTYTMDPSCVSVTEDGNKLNVTSVELQKDGGFYIFLDEEAYLSADSKNVVVSFTNATPTFTYSTTVAPDSWTKPNQQVLDFANETAYYAEELFATSVAYQEAELVSSNPVEASFEISENISEFSFTFNKNVYSVATDNNDAPTAVLSSTSGFSEQLAIKEGSAESSATLTFVRTGSDPLVKGDYTVEVSGVVNEKDILKGSSDFVSFEVGKSNIPTTTYTELLSVNYSANDANMIPLGWTVNNEGEIRESGFATTSGPRLFSFPAGGDITRALYLRAKFPDADATTPNECSALYGDLEGYSLTIPAGDVQLDVPCFAWKVSGVGVSVLVTKLDGTPVANDTAYCTNNANGLTSWLVAADKVSVRFTSDGGQYLVKIFAVATGTNWTEVMVGGFTVSSYVETKGDSGESTTVFEEKFTSVAANVTPAAGSGWEIYDANAMLNKNQSYSGAGSRIFQLSNTTNLTGAYYCRMLGTVGEYYAIYGNGGEGEPTLALSSGKNQFTYYGANWKTASRLCYFNLLDENDNVVISRIDTLTANLDGNVATACTANKIQFTYSIPADGNYKMKFWFDGEAMVGNISILKVGSMAVYYKSMLRDALTSAQAEYEKASLEEYAGTTYNALGAAIAAYTDPDFHTPIEYTTAVENLEQLVLAMAARRANISTYATLMTDIPAILSDADNTKFVNLEAYPVLTDLYNRYSTISSSSLEDADLIAANTELNNNYTWMKNMMNECVALLTKQVVDAAALIVKLDDTQAEESCVIAAGDAISDDQSLMASLKLYMTAAIYKACAAGDPFNIFDEEYQANFPDSIDVTPYIQNANLYSTSYVRDNVAADVLPGWTMNQIKAAPGVGFGWVAWTGSQFHPATDARLICGWNTEADLSQKLTQLPVGVYSVVAGTQDRGLDTDSAKIYSTLRYELLDESGATTAIDSVAFDVTNQGTYYDLTRCVMPHVAVKGLGSSVYGAIKVGAHVKSYQSTASVDEFALTMTAKDPTFDYAAALAVVQHDIATSIAQVATPEGEPTSVKYFDLNGSQIAQPNGICIKLSTYKGGFMKVQKVIVK